MATERHDDDRITDLLRDGVPTGARGVSFEAVARGAARRRRRQTLATAAAGLVLVLGAGTALAASGVLGGEDRTSVPPAASTSPSPQPRPTASDSSAPTVPHSAAPLSVLTVSEGQPRRYVVGDGTVGAPESSLYGPGEGRIAGSASVSAGKAPTTCVVWATATPSSVQPGDSPSSIVCYPAGAQQGSVVQGTGDRVGVVGLSADGARLAWTTLAADGLSYDLVVADLSGGAVTNPRTVKPGVSVGGGLPYSPQTLAWAGDGVLLVGLRADDDGGSLRRLELTDAGIAAGWTKAAAITPADGFALFGGVVSVDGSTALAVERNRYDVATGTPPATPGRAVRIDWRTGAVLDVIATAGQGREMAAVAGTSAGVVYTTRTAADQNGTGPTSTYLQAPGQGRVLLDGVTGVVAASS